MINERPIAAGLVKQPFSMAVASFFGYITTFYLLSMPGLFRQNILL
ncbi:MAG: hypothetical protein ACOX9E_10030 [Lentisphaeria bacterium]|jgi:hypothetical protein